MTKIHTADAIQWAQEYEGERFHALLCDPPYHLTSITKRFQNGEPEHTKTAQDIKGRKTPHARQAAGFMGKSWDGGDIAFRPETWAAFLPLLYPGAFGMAFAGSRGWHRMACAIEDAGFLIHPTIFCWATSQSFPKATRVKSDKEVWQGHRYGGMALKNAVEPIIVFQKPYKGKPVDCITQTGAGALNIDGSRIGGATLNSRKNGVTPDTGYGLHTRGEVWEGAAGRWASNLVMDTDCAERINTADEFFFTFDFKPEDHDPVIYCPKAGRAERDAGLDAFDMHIQKMPGKQTGFTPSTGNVTDGYTGERRNPHPTLKPLRLLKHLATLLLPPAAYAPRRLFVPFAGAGSEVCAAHLAGWEDVQGVEREEEYAEIARARLKFWSGNSGLFEELTQEEEACEQFSLDF